MKGWDIHGRDKSDVGARLALAREALGFDQATFAREAGLKPPAYNQYETGKNLPNILAAHAICDRYSLTLDWIYRGDSSGLRYETAQAIHAIYKLRHA